MEVINPVVSKLGEMIEGHEEIQERLRDIQETAAKAGISHSNSRLKKEMLKSEREVQLHDRVLWQLEYMERMERMLVQVTSFMRKDRD